MSGQATSTGPAFSDPRRETAADRFAMWIFVGSEAMLFGAVLLVFLMGRIEHGEAFAAASKRLSLPLGTLNTAVLLTSSFTMALADAFIAAGRRRPALCALVATAGLGLVFLAVKASEYAKEISEGLAPVLGLPFTYDGPDPRHAEFFFKLYFVMTVLHALHLILGIATIAALLVFWRRLRGAGAVRSVTAIGLYWHFVDIVWVFLFPVLYLIDR